MPNCKHPEYLQNINDALVEGSINTCLRQAAFLAQLAHESGQLVYMEELASGEAYEGRKDLGNTQPGDGKRYKGRGPIQLTGRANYRAAGQALGLDLEGNPEQVKTPQVGFRVAVWFWTTRKLNDLADQGTLESFRQITKKINGGTNGQADREQYWAKAKNALGCGTGTTGVSGPACTANGSSGVCISTSDCKGRSVPGYCKGPANIQCCI
jgi:putative chitinase